MGEESGDETDEQRMNHLRILNETDLAPTDDEPIPDPTDDDESEMEGFDMKPIEFKVTQLVEKRKKNKDQLLSDKERRKAKIKQRRASSKLKATKTTKSKEKNGSKKKKSNKKSGHSRTV